MDSKISFVIGWNYGKANKVELTAREISAQFSDVDSDAFAQGNIDGMREDRFRLDPILGQRRMW